MDRGTKGEKLRSDGRRGAKLGTAARRAVVLSALWWALTEGRIDALGFGIPTVVLATLVSMGLAPVASFRTRVRRAPQAPPYDEARARLRVRPFGLLRLVVYFLYGSLRGGVDVARRALTPRLPLFPTVVVYRSDLTPGLAQNLFVGCMNLMPGTLGVELDGRDIRVHVLSDSEQAMRGLMQLEERVASALGLPFPERKT